jgi:hypothetical protein
VYESYDKGEYLTITKFQKIMKEKIGYSGLRSSILRIRKWFSDAEDAMTEESYRGNTNGIF